MTDPLAAAERDLAHAFVSATGAMVVVVDRTGRIRMVNPALEEFTGLPAAELVGQAFWDVYVVPGDVLPAQHAFAAALSTRAGFAVEADWVATGGVLRRVAMHNSVLLDPGGEPYAVACVAVDVTAVHRRGTTDVLTGVLNRAGLFEVLAGHLDPRRGQGCGLLFCDLDDFKSVNDRHGHAAGDRLLVEVARRLRESTRPADAIARIGGDEFVVLTPAVEEVELVSLTERVAAHLHEPLGMPGGPDAVRVSIGGAVGRPGDDPDAVLERADSAMYRIKRHRIRHRRPRS
ncbi:diguanylate cyclase domain-containing protein [Geodermatophilus sp. SYSU D00815]